MNRDHQVFLVLGMHRSATSVVAQGLHEAGVYMGDRLLGAHASNPQGHWENMDFLELHIQLLSEAGGTWKSPPDDAALEKAWKKNTENIQQVLTQTQTDANGRAWGWKDPRTVLFAKQYIKMLYSMNCDIFLINCWRGAGLIAKSLQKRNGLPFADGLRLAEYYHEKMREAEQCLI